MTLHGSCMCGATAFTSPSEPILTALCHCVDCQKWTGSAFTSNVVVPRDTFKVTKGTPKFFDIADNGEASLRNKVDIEFFVKDRVSYLAAVDVAKQEPRFG
ncbi:hypothetical protein N7494_005272 [Penicillium frequentans]|uniref:CENP-V/GFA domain-containing protein n=1 Tax=Penicillium frequentans TaxID=3151616 RepID=A0AAD6GF97_9EURO|nr:hypothetical protein N7494_005272 [Penicillium glabrum]